MNFQRSFEQLLENRAWVWLSDWPLTLCGAIIILSSKAAFGYHNWHHFGRSILFLISNLIGCRNDLVILLFRAKSKFRQRLFHKILGRDHCPASPFLNLVMSQVIAYLNLPPWSHQPAWKVKTWQSCWIFSKPFYNQPTEIAGYGAWPTIKVEMYFYPG